jgi:hypothetical protein
MMINDGFYDVFEHGKRIIRAEVSGGYLSPVMIDTDDGLLPWSARRYRQRVSSINESLKLVPVGEKAGACCDKCQWSDGGADCPVAGAVRPESLSCIHAMRPGWSVRAVSGGK